jgi:hypothetical protein
MTALELIKQGWTQGHTAIDILGDWVNPMSPDAVKWCSVGAIERAYTVGTAGLAREKLEKVIGTAHLAKWNDAPERTHAEVIAAFEKAGI